MIKKIVATTKKIADKAASWLKKETSTTGGKIAAAVIAAGLVIGIWALVTFRAVILGTVGVVLVGFFVLWTRLTSSAPPSTPAPTVEEVCFSLELFVNHFFEELRQTLPIFRGVYADPVPTTETGAMRHCPRLTFWREVHNGIVVACMGLLCVSGIAPAPLELIRGRQVLQELITDSFWRGCFPLSGSPIYSDGTPTLCLYDITTDGIYLQLRFVWVDNDTTAAFVHRHDLPPTGGDGDDLDF